MGTSPVFAFPPAPHHTLYGLVRDELGDPLLVTDAEVVLESLTGTQLMSRIVPQLSPGQNYRLHVPLDAGLTADNYKPTALRPTVAFRMKVKIGRLTYLPLETRANYANLGKPAQATRLDLTLGEDTDGDGLPDAWERALIAQLGGQLALQDIPPDDDADGDGLTNLQEYLAGTYAFDPQDGFWLDLVGLDHEQPVIEFLAIRGRTYTLVGSTDWARWVGASPIPLGRRNRTAARSGHLRCEGHPYPAPTSGRRPQRRATPHARLQAARSIAIAPVSPSRLPRT
ncbi:MAG: hypothetical protein FJ387_29835 [Verrucomicrobia bacterium]|nr:hypothetical protein [Verrucomicrobiota bacterium]